MQHVVNLAEIVMLILVVVLRFSAVVALVYLIFNSRISVWWQVFLATITIVIGLGFSIKYDNPNNHIQPEQAITQSENEK